MQQLGIFAAEPHDESEWTASRQKELSQYMAPRWAPPALLDAMGNDAPAKGDRVLEPACGRGSWLHAIDKNITVIAIEKDPRLARIAHIDTGRHIIVGDRISLLKETLVK
jgi:predicted RNA methylase